MPSQRDRSKAILAEIGVSTPPRGAIFERSRQIGLTENPFGSAADTSGMIDTPSTFLDREIVIPEQNPFGEGADVDVSAMQNPFGDDDEAAGRPSKRALRFSISELEEKRTADLAIAANEKYPDKHVTAIKERYKRQIDQLKAAEAEEAPAHQHADDEGPFRRAFEWVADKYEAIPKVPGAETVGDIIAGDTREDKRGLFDKAADVAMVVANPIPTMIRRGFKTISDIREKGWEQAAKEQESLQESGQGLREFTGDVVGETNILDAISMALTLGTGSAVKALGGGARIARAGKAAHLVAGAADVATGVGVGGQGAVNAIEGYQEGDFAKGALGVLQGGLGALGVTQGVRTAKLPFTDKAKMAGEFMDIEQRIAAINAANPNPTAIGVSTGDDIVSLIRVDARFGGSTANPLDVNTAVNFSKNLTDEQVALVKQGSGAASDVDLLSSNIDARQRNTEAARRMLDGTPDNESLQGKMLRQLRAARSINAETEALRRAERARRFGRVEGEITGSQSLDDIAAARGQLAGELPRSSTTMPTEVFTQADKDELASRILDNDMTVVEKTRAANVLMDLINNNPVPPRQADIDLLGQVIGLDVARELGKASKKTLGWWAKEFAGIPRTLMASMDLSALGRQGLVASIRHPKFAFKAFYNSLGVAKNGEAFQGMIDGFINDPLYTMAKDSGLHFGSVGGLRHDINQAARGLAMGSEDWAPSKLLTKELKVKGLDMNPINLSTRQYTAFLDKLRFDIFKGHAEKLSRMGISPVSNPSVYQGYADLINVSTGRGKLPQALENHAQSLAQVFWSPRLMASRLALLNPRFYAKLPPTVRAEAISTALAAAGVSAGTLALLSTLPGVSVNWDPRSTDFGKLKLGNTRISLMGGQEGYLVVAAKLLTAQYISETQQVRELTGDYPDKSRFDVAKKFVRGKLAPIPGFVMDMWEGRDFSGRKFDATDKLVEMVTPMVLGDLIEALKIEGFAEDGYWETPGFRGFDIKQVVVERPVDALRTGATLIPSVFGFGTQTYEQREPSRKEIMKRRKADARKTIRGSGSVSQEVAEPVVDDIGPNPFE